VETGFTILNDTLGNGDYLAGEFSVADPILFCVEFWADKSGIALPDNLLAHYRRMLTRPAVQRVLREEGYNTATLGTFPPSAAPRRMILANPCRKDDTLTRE
jgi:glutathione S-transferase